MKARQVATTLLVAVLLTSGSYVLVYLYRWEWNRAQICFLLFLAAEVALLGVLVLGRLERAARAAPHRPAAQRVLEDLRAAAPPPHRPFAWLSPRNGELTVFVPILMASGILLAALAWIVERVAGRVATPVLERGLAGRLQTLALPTSLLSPHDDAESLLLPTPRAP